MGHDRRQMVFSEVRQLEICPLSTMDEIHLCLKKQSFHLSYKKQNLSNWGWAKKKIGYSTKKFPTSQKNEFHQFEVLLIPHLVMTDEKIFRFHELNHLLMSLLSSADLLPDGWLLCSSLTFLVSYEKSLPITI
jgi:hypothetical protein